MKKFLFICSLVALAACKQGEGERCQVTSDCEEPLICNIASQECQGTSGTSIDANLPVDAPTDAAIDMLDAFVPQDAPDAPL